MMPASMVIEFSWKVKEAVGPSTFDILIGALILLQRANIDCRCCAHLGEAAGPAHCMYAAGSNEGLLKTG